MAKLFEVMKVVWQQAPLLYLLLAWAVVTVSAVSAKVSAKRIFAGNATVACGMLAYWGPIVDPQFASIYMLVWVPCVVAGYVACKG
jgi:hypothetical protein